MVVELDAERHVTDVTDVVVGARLPCGAERLVDLPLQDLGRVPAAVAPCGS
jgi:hypothetical protein